MHDIIDKLIGLEIGAVTGILVLCGLVLCRGGVSPNDRCSKPTRLQRLMGIRLLLIAVGFIPFIINDQLLDEPQPWLAGVITATSFAWLGFIPIDAFVLRQKPLTPLLCAKVFGPTLPMLLVSPFCESYPTLFLILSVITYLYIIGVILHALYRLKQWDDIMLELYSDVVNKQTRWYRQLMLPFLGLMLLWIPYYIWPSMVWLDLIYYTVEIYVFVRFTTFALTQEEFVIDEMSVEEMAAETDTPTATKPAWAERMELAIVKEHLYRQKGLARDNLAVVIGINRTYISQYLHDVRHITFYAYINDFRLDESEQLLRNGDMSIAEIAEQCGFRDRNAFYRCFAKRHNMSPSEWQKAEVILR